MTDLNMIMFVGRLTKDCETRYSQSGIAVTRFSIANNYRKKSGDQWVDDVNFFDVVLIGKSAESLAQYLTKGRQVCVQGELRQSRWEQNGESKSRYEILAISVQLFGNSQNSQASQNSQPPQAPQPEPSRRAVTSQPQRRVQYSMPPVPPARQNTPPVPPAPPAPQNQHVQQSLDGLNGPESWEDIPF